MAVLEGRSPEPDPSAPVVMRAGAATYVVFAIVFGLLLALVLAPAIQGKPMLLRSGSKVLLEGWPATCVIAGFPVGMAAVFFTWIRAFRIEAREDRLSYTTLFTGTRSITLSEIAHARYCIGGRRNRGDPFVRLELEPRPGSGAPFLKINLKVLRRPDVVRLLERVRAYCPVEDGMTESDEPANRR
jgi:hypothetical protein